ncbi:hypothetical protein NA8A_11450 [Nitratireductor indicus C115]|uniref:Uncharacterized protein n=1 Tax=Nitratireductor indicus C115 TaxID=1231190 RepID=K2P481_9HYPH|nr:hypothetical protein NA8A_11450 [Nitratireductor indicus C115]
MTLDQTRQTVPKYRVIVCYDDAVLAQFEAPIVSTIRMMVVP